MLFLVQLLEVRQRVLVFRIEAKDFSERLESPIDESAALVVESEAEQDVGVLELPQVRSLQQRLVFLDGAADLSLFAVEVAQNQVDLERVAGCRRPRG